MNSLNILLKRHVLVLIMQRPGWINRYVFIFKGMFLFLEHDQCTAIIFILLVQICFYLTHIENNLYLYYNVFFIKGVITLYSCNLFPEAPKHSTKAPHLSSVKKDEPNSEVQYEQISIGLERTDRNHEEEILHEIESEPGVMKIEVGAKYLDIHYYSVHTTHLSQDAVAVTQLADLLKKKYQLVESYHDKRSEIRPCGH